jgi:hypothetical protein
VSAVRANRPVVLTCSPELAPFEALKQHDGHDQQQQDQDRHRARDRQVAVLEELIRQHAADHQLIGAAEQRRNHVLAHRRDEHQQAAGEDAGERLRQRDRQERAKRPCAQIRRRLEQRRVVLLEVRVQRQDHERQIRIHDADIHREVGLHQHQWTVDDAEVQQHVVDDAVVVQQPDPGVHAQQERGPERQHHQHQQHRARGGGRARDGIRHRITDQQTAHGRDCGNLERVQVGADVQGVGEQELVC